MKKELLYSLRKKDFRIDYFRAQGKGGQAVNKISSACRVTHIESGAVGQSQESRMQHANRKIAFERLTKSTKFQLWHRLKCADLLSRESLHSKVEKAVDAKNIKVEVFKEGKWVEEYKLFKDVPVGSFFIRYPVTGCFSDGAAGTVWKKVSIKGVDYNAVREHDPDQWGKKVNGFTPGWFTPDSKVINTEEPENFLR